MIIVYFLYLLLNVLDDLIFDILNLNLNIIVLFLKVFDFILHKMSSLIIDTIITLERLIKIESFCL